MSASIQRASGMLGVRAKLWLPLSAFSPPNDAFPPSDELQDLTTMWFKRSSATTSSLILLACPVIALHWSGRGRLRLLRKPASWLVAVCERSESRGCGGVVVAERERNLAVPLC